MKRLSLALGCAVGILIFGCGGGSNIPKGWIDWSSDEWRVSVAFPFKPTSTVAGRFPGVVKSEAFICRSAETFDLICVELMDAPKTPEAIKTSLDSVRTSVEAQSRARLIKEEDSAEGNYPGRRFEFQTVDGRTYQVRVILCDTRSYALGAITTKGKANSEEVKAFFQSIRIR